MSFGNLRRWARKSVDALSASFSTTAAYTFYRKYPRLRLALGAGEPTYTGRIVTEATALNCAVVWAAVSVISDAIAAMPLHLYRRGQDDSRERARDHPLYALLHDLPNPETTAFQLRQTMQAHLLTWGNAYARIVRPTGDSQRVLALTLIKPGDITRIERRGGGLVYFWNENGREQEPISGADMLHLRGLGFDGVQGYSVISMARQTIGLAQIEEEYAAKFFARGGRRPYLLEHPQRFKTDTDFENFREKWEKVYADPDNFYRAPILEGGLKYQELGFDMEDSQFLGARQFGVPEICRWFKVSPHLVHDLSRATFSNIEHLAIEFVTHTLGPWMKRWEQEISRCLLTAEERQSYYAEFNPDSLLRGDFESRTRGYSTLLQNGVLSINEVRRLENMNAIEGGGDHHIQLNMQSLPGGAPTTGQAAALFKIGKRQEE